MSSPNIKLKTAWLALIPSLANNTSLERHLTTNESSWKMESWAGRPSEPIPASCEPLTQSAIVVHMIKHVLQLNCPEFDSKRG